MEFALHSPPFWTSFTALLGLYFFSYCLGFVIFRITGFSPKGKIHSEFSRLLTGYLVLLFFFVIFETKGATIFTGLLIPFLFLGSNRFFTGKDKVPFLPQKEMIFVHLFFIAAIFGFEFFSNVNPLTGNLFETHIDRYVYGRYCAHIGITGEENLFVDWYQPLAQGNSLYHYIDLWGGVLAQAVSGIGYFYSLTIIAYSFSVTIACWAALSFLESLKYGLRPINVLLSLSLIFLSPLAQIMQDAFEFAVNDSRIYSESLSENPKLAFVSVFLLFTLRQFGLRDYKGGFLALSILIIVYSALIPTLLFSVLMFSVFLLFKEKHPLKTVSIWVLPFFASLAFVFLFYRFSRGFGFDARIVDSGYFIDYYSDLHNLIIGFKLTVVVALSGLASVLLFFPFIGFTGVLDKSKRMLFLQNPVFVFLGIFVLGGLLCFGLFHPLMDSPQFWSIAVSVGTSVAVLWFMTKLFDSIGQIPFKVYGALVLGYLVWQNLPEAVEVKNEYQTFLNRVLEINHSDTLKFSVFFLPSADGLLWKDQNVYFPMMVLSSQMKEFKPVSLTMRESVREKRPFYDRPLQNMIRTSEINLYVEAQKKSGVFVSESESKLSFIREFGIPFAMIAPTYEPDSVLAPHFMPRVVSPTGWKFCEFIDLPSN